MCFDDIRVGMPVEITLAACNQKGEPVLTDVTEAIVKYREQMEEL